MSNEDDGERFYHYVKGEVVDFCLKCNAYPSLFKLESGDFMIGCDVCDKYGEHNKSLLMAVLEWNKVERRN